MNINPRFGPKSLTDPDILCNKCVMTRVLVASNRLPVPPSQTRFRKRVRGVRLRVPGAFHIQRHRQVGNMMRYFFDIHLNGECHLDKVGQEFRSALDARAYVLACARTCMTGSAPQDRKVLSQVVIEITDHKGTSDVITLVDTISSTKRSEPRAATRRPPLRHRVSM